MNRSVLMLKALIAFLIPGAFVRTLGDAEHALEMSKNEQFRREGTAAQDVHRKEAVERVRLRLTLLRRCVLRAGACIISAVVAAMMVNRLSGPTCLQSLRLLFTLLSVSLFAWATLGRLGRAGQSWKSDTVVERLDQVLFWSSYWLGTFFGVLAVV